MTLTDREVAVWREADSLFAELMALAPEARSQSLASLNIDQEVRACLEQLLNASEQSGVLDGESILHTAPPPSDALSGQTIGGWTLGEEIGRGGMAVVYAAHREGGEFTQEAAIKLLPRGMAGQERFAQEQRVLAGLEHAHIARFLDGGVDADGTPWIAMERIRGQRIDARVDPDRPRDTVRLLLPVIDAVAYAHRHLIVHRDLKPGNVLVDEQGQPKLLDFGIAKLLSEDSGEAATRALTPGYAAPEQYAGQAVSTATDVYGIGALLHYLLSGETPIDGQGQASHAMEQAGLDKDLLNIVSRALRHDPGERYATAQAMSADLRNWLTGRPVEATSDSQWYRLRKWLGRHKAAALASTVALLVLVVGSAVVTWQAHQASQQAQLVSAQNAVLTRLLESPQIVARGRQAKVIDVLADSEPLIREYLPEASAQRAQLFATVARTQRQLEDPGRSIPLWQAALTDTEQLANFSPRHRIDYLRELAQAHGENNDPQQAMELLSQAESEIAERLPQDTELKALVAGTRLYVMAMQRDANLQQAYAKLDTLAQEANWSLPAHHGFVLCAKLEGLVKLGQFQQAAVIGQEFLTWSRQALGERHSHTLCAYRATITARSRSGDKSGAEQLAAVAEQVAVDWLGENDRQVYTFRVARANALQEQSRHAEAMALHQSLLQLRDSTPGLTAMDRIIPMQGLAIALGSSGDYGGAVGHQQNAVRALGDAFGTEHPQSLIAQANLAELLIFAGRAEEAVPIASAALKKLRPILGEQHPVTFFVQNVYGGAQISSGDWQQALITLDGLTDTMAGAFGSEDINVINSRYWTAQALLRSGERARAAALGSGAVQAITEHYGPDHPRSRAAHSWLDQAGF